MVTVSFRLTWSSCKLHGHLVRIVAWHPVTEIKMADHIWGWREFFDIVSSLLAAASWQYGTANHGTVSMWLRGWECVAHIRTTYLPTSAISTVGKVLGSFGGQGVSGSLYSSH